MAGVAEMLRLAGAWFGQTKVLFREVEIRDISPLSHQEDDRPLSIAERLEL